MFYLCQLVFLYLAGQLAAAETITDFLRGRPDLSEVCL
jgi:hypothetical protein